MKKKWMIGCVLFAYFLLVGPTLKAQFIFMDEVNEPSPQFETIDLDNSFQTIYYEYEFPEYLQESAPKKKVLSVLQIGNRHSKFTDFYKLAEDSLTQEFSKLKTIGGNEINEKFRIKEKQGLRTEIIRDNKLEELWMQPIFRTKIYEYKQPVPKFDWILKNKEKKILGYTVKKANLKFGGREWIAWYSEEIPVFLGPYFFGELPGLILEMKDKSNTFHFMAVGIHQEDKIIYRRKENSIIKTSKEKFILMEKEFYLNPHSFIQTYGEDEVIPYNPVEFLKN